MKLISAEWVDNWSWGLVFKSLIDNIPGMEAERLFKGDMSERVYDVLLCQQVTLFKNWLSANKKTITRLGGNMTFEDIESSAAKFYLEKMRQCFAVIATNKKLYDIGKRVNPKTYLIPNGLDLTEWRPSIMPRDSGSPLVVGFVGNIDQPAYRRYKGYDIARAAGNGVTGFKFRHALRGDQQIPHDKMMQEFYWQIDVLLHPTAGEGCSNTIMEACACGVPIITTREAGFHGELMKHRENVLFCERSEDGIKKCLFDFSEPGVRGRLAAGARAFAEDHHDIVSVAEAYRRIIEDCHASNGGKAARSIGGVGMDAVISKLDEILSLLKNKPARGGRKK